MNIKKIIKRLPLILENNFLPSYGQCGEDCILVALFGLLEISRPTYLDVGAHHPTYLSNTYLLYTRESKGVCIEPNPQLCRNIQKTRTRDTCLNIGIGADESAALDFYIFDDPVMSTFSDEISREQVGSGRRIIDTVKVPVVSINSVIKQYFSACPNLISLDTEGLDMVILQSFDFGKYRPQVFCIETLTNTSERKMTEIIDFMLSENYLVYADTYLNTIFVDKFPWSEHLLKRQKI